jgi:hypothetical protein
VAIDNSVKAGITRLLQKSTGGRVPFWSVDDACEDLAAGQPGEAWEKITIAGKTLPGWAGCTGGKGRRVDMKFTPGSDGATPTHLGHDPSEIKLALYFWKDAHLRAFEALVPVLQGRGKDGAPRPVQVSHPALAIYGIRVLYFMRLGIMHPAPTHGVMTVELDASEFKPSGKTGLLDTPQFALTNLGDQAPPIPYRPDFKPSETVTGPQTPQRRDFGRPLDFR